LVIGTIYQINEKSHTANDQEDAIDTMTTHQPAVLVLKTVYLCGTETERLEFETFDEIDIWTMDLDDEWMVKSQSDKEVVMVREALNELSPQCKENGYFGLAQDATLTFYDGHPEENQVIQTFFRIDTERLKTSLPLEETHSLKEGIRVYTVAQYLSVLSTYGEFALEETS
jgi:forespore regulator of the sigma-K checkpoint